VRLSKPGYYHEGCSARIISTLRQTGGLLLHTLRIYDPRSEHSPLIGNFFYDDITATELTTEEAAWWMLTELSR
jgi:hypothetical protein